MSLLHAAVPTMRMTAQVTIATVTTGQAITMTTTIILRVSIASGGWCGVIRSFGTSALAGMIPGTTLGMAGTAPISTMVIAAGLTGDGAGIIIPDGIADGVITAITAIIFPIVPRWHTATMASEAAEAV